MDAAFQTLAHVVELRRVRSSLSDGEASRRLGAVTAQLRRDVGVGVPKRRAAKLLGVSVQALDRWVASGVLPVVRVPDSSRQLIDAEALLVLAEEVARRREQGESRGVVAAALHHLADEGRLPRKFRPNQSAAELRHEYLQTTPAERLRLGVELSELAARLAARPVGALVARAAPGPATPPRFFEFLRTLCDHQVDFVLIGGFAVTLHGYVRATKDIDLVPEPSRENMARLWDALDPLKLERGCVPASGGNSALDTKFGRIGIVRYVETADGEIPFGELRERAERVELEEIGTPIFVASGVDLIAMKEHANRDIDRIDLTALRMAQGLEE